jgi:hypothetical protein
MRVEVLSLIISDNRYPIVLQIALAFPHSGAKLA